LHTTTTVPPHPPPLDRAPCTPDERGGIASQSPRDDRDPWRQLAWLAEQRAGGIDLAALDVLEWRVAPVFLDAEARGEARTSRSGSTVVTVSSVLPNGRGTRHRRRREGDASASTGNSLTYEHVVPAACSTMRLP
jgi:hypothetical protein